MSTQRYKYAVLPGGMDPHPDGDWVTYADHVAEIEQIHQDRDEKQGIAVLHTFRVAADAMREACVSTAWKTRGWFTDEYPDNEDGEYKPVVLLEDVVAALREVQP